MSKCLRETVGERKWGESGSVWERVFGVLRETVYVSKRLCLLESESVWVREIEWMRLFVRRF